MKHFVVLGTLIAALSLPATAEAKGCIKGAIVGGVAGHVAGHGKLGAVAGCVIGHHQANKNQGPQPDQHVRDSQAKQQ